MLAKYLTDYSVHFANTVNFGGSLKPGEITWQSEYKSLSGDGLWIFSESK